MEGRGLAPRGIHGFPKAGTNICTAPEILFLRTVVLHENTQVHSRSPYIRAHNTMTGNMARTHATAQVRTQKRRPWASRGGELESRLLSYRRGSDKAHKAKRFNYGMTKLQKQINAKSRKPGFPWSRVARRNEIPCEELACVTFLGRSDHASREGRWLKNYPRKLLTQNVYETNRTNPEPKPKATPTSNQSKPNPDPMPIRA